MTIFATAMTSGVLLALAAHMLTGRFGVALSGVWQDLFPTGTQAARSALGWWLIAGAGFAGSFLAGLVAQRQTDDDSPWPGPRLAGLVVFLLLAAVPHLATATPSRTMTFALGVNLAVFALGIATAFCGSWFALPATHDPDPGAGGDGAPPPMPGDSGSHAP